MSGVLDNSYIFEFKGEDAITIPDMKIEDLENILNKEMKLRKACDICKLTVEHLRYAGLDAKLVILRLLNEIIQNIYYLTCPQVKIGLSTAVYKGKRIPVAESSSYYCYSPDWKHSRPLHRPHGRSYLPQSPKPRPVGVYQSDIIPDGST